MTTVQPASVLAVLEDHYGLAGTDVVHLGGELDHNASVTLADGSRVVVKIAPPGADTDRILWQHDLIRRADGALGAVRVPRVRTALDGTSVVTAALGGPPRAVAVYDWLDGTTLSGLAVRPPELLAELGATAARLARAVAGAPDPPGAQTHHWDVLRAAESVAEGLHAVTDPARRATVTRILGRCTAALDRHGADLPHAVVHQDLNDFNVLLRHGPDGHRLHGVLDFGDALRTARVGELVVAVAYAVLRTPDPLTAAAAVVAGFAAEEELTDPELAVLFPLVAARLCVNAVTWTHREGEAGAGYGTERMRHTWPAIERLAAVPPELAEAVLRAAAGRTDPARAVPPPGTAAFPGPPEGVELGRHLDPGPGEPVRRTTAPGESATLRLGLSVAAPGPFTVHTPLAATVEDGDTAGLLLRHDTPDAGPLWSRWTGLTGQHREGGTLAAGDPIGRAASVTVALFRSRETASLAPTAPVPASQAGGWAAVSPDPAGFAGFPQAERPPGGWDAERVVRTRAVHFARSQRSYYRRPMNLVGGRGTWLYDDAGRAYLDAINNVSHVGHSNPRVVEAAAAQMRRLNTNSRFVYPGIAQYAERLTATLPAGLEVAFLVCSGSEANDLAIRMARQVTGRRDVLVVDGAYHGSTSTVTGLSPNRYKGPGGTGPDPTTHEVEQPDRYRGRHGYDDPRAGSRYAADVRRQAERLTAAGTPPAAFIAESAMGTAGSIFYPDGYLAESFAAVRAAGGLCVSDEVQVGFGRLGDVFWGFESQGVVPDIVTMGKPIGNGHPMAAVVTTREIADAFDSGMKYFNTFGGNPVSCAIGTAVLDEIEERGLQQHAAVTGCYFKDLLGGLAGRHEVVGEVRGHGMYLGIELVRDRDGKVPATAEALRISEAMKDEGVIVYPTGADNSVLKVKPPLTFTRADADLFMSVLDEVLGRDR